MSKKDFVSIFEPFARPFVAGKLAFFPECLVVSQDQVESLIKFLEGRKPVVITGAGLSTESGVPDYRSKGFGLYSKKSYTPIIFKDFLNSEHTRKRHWSRNFVGWPRFSSVQPNISHLVLSILQYNHLISSIITQNVDGLHSKAHCKDLVELHGTSYYVVCLSCDYKVDRHAFQETLTRFNPDFQAESHAINPDGDVQLTDAMSGKFNLVPCPKCNGILKPDIVFFGDSVPKSKVALARNAVDASDALLIFGSSMTVYSSYRLMLQASELRKPIAAVTIGPTRNDSLINLKLSYRCGDVLGQLFSKLLGKKIFF